MSISSLNSDLDSIIAHAGVSVTIGATTDYGVLRRDAIDSTLGDEDLEVVGRTYTVTVREGKFSGLTEDALVTANGVEYRIRHPGVALPDGTRKLTLVEASP